MLPQRPGGGNSKFWICLMSDRDIRSLDIAMLRTFSALMRERSVSRAAGQLFLSQPAVSASLNRLRRVFGDPLFTRDAHGVSPTPRALALGPQVERLLADVSALLQDQGPFDLAGCSRIFRLAGSDHASHRILPRLAQALSEAASPARVVWETAGTQPLAELLHKGRLDLAVVARIHPPRDMQTEVLYEDDYVFVCRPDHALAGDPLTLDAFCATPQVFLGYGSSALEDVIDEVLARAGRQRLAQLAVPTFAQMVDLLEKTGHAAVIARRVATTLAPRLHVQELPFTLPRYQMLACWSAQRGPDPALDWLRAQVRSAMVATH